VKIGQKVLKWTPEQKLERFLVGVLAGSKAASRTANTRHLDPSLISTLCAAWMPDQSSPALCWLPTTSVLKRNSVHPRISPVRSVLSRLHTRVSQPAGRAWLSRSRRLFRLFPECNLPLSRGDWSSPALLPCVSEAVFRCAGSSTRTFSSWTMKQTRPASFSRSMVPLRASCGTPASRLASVLKPGASCEASALP
jgi:hypothetical protein